MPFWPLTSLVQPLVNIRSLCTTVHEHALLFFFSEIPKLRLVKDTFSSILSINTQNCYEMYLEHVFEYG